jgi:type IV secretion system protein VirD4
MTQLASDARSPPSTNRWAYAGRTIAGGAAVLVMIVWLAGYGLLWSLHLPVVEATPLTVWRYAYYHGARASVRHRVVASLVLATVAVSAVAAPALWPASRSLHGDARFARRGEIRRAGLLGERGIILGALGRRCLMLDGQQGVALAAPPRSGKGVGIVIPNALSWPDSLVCVDIKRENWTLTAGYRARCGQRCYLFDPFAEDGATARWNPFFYVSDDAMRRVNDLQRIAEMLYPDPPNVDPFWTASARSLFMGIALYLFETPSVPRTIGEVLRQGMASDDEGFGHHWKRLIEGRNSGRFPLSPQCVRALYDVIDLAPVTASSIRKTFTSRLDLWLNPILDAATSGNDFDLRRLRRAPMSIYVGVNPDDLHRLRPVLSLFFQQAIGLQTRALPERDPALRCQVMMLLDEFTALGRIPIIAESISYLPGYNVRVVLVIQTLAQLREVYGANAAETMLKSLAVRIVFAPKDFGDAKEISQELGDTTVRVRSWSRPVGQWLERKTRGRSINVSEQRRALLLPQEVKELGAEEALVFYEGLRPIRCRKLRYFSDPRFRVRLCDPPQVVPVQTCADLQEAEAEAQAGDTVMHDSTGDAMTIEPAARASVREATLEDIDRLDALTLEDFAADVGQLTLPLEGRMSEQELQGAVEEFLATLREA